MEPSYPSQTTEELAVELVYERSLETHYRVLATMSKKMNYGELLYGQCICIYERSQHKADEIEAHIMDRAFDQAKTND